MVRSRALRFAWFAPPLLLVIAASSLLGPGLPGWDEIASLDAATPYWRFRVPRTVLAAVVGAGLAVGGAIFQALFRNPLAEPYTLGVASGAALGAAIGFYFGLDGRLGGLPVRSGLALAGAAGAMGLVYLMARLRAGRDMQRLLLAGVCVAYASAAGILLTTFLADRSVTGEIVVWLMG